MCEAVRYRVPSAFVQFIQKMSTVSAASVESAVIEVPEKKPLKPCCACPETKKVRDACIIEKGEESYLTAPFCLCVCCCARRPWVFPAYLYLNCKGNVTMHFGSDRVIFL
ncbi:hypothetical protein EPR50_G00114790 [Perca flavescens]|uniref:Uncharacterized protein n=1 Tax=Perca flavescens TaxID=8167 RepID=A0A484CRQ7_PERFV|nr:hypothetical protein EPR50_G00114790 [Perca flavescens]